MSTFSKEKGKRFERILARMFRECGYNAHRTAQYKGKTGDAGDIEGVPDIHVECKHQEKMQLYAWMEQCIRDTAAEGKKALPVVIHKGNKKPILVTMRYEDWVKLLIKYHM